MGRKAERGESTAKRKTSQPASEQPTSTTVSAPPAAAPLTEAPPQPPVVPSPPKPSTSTEPAPAKKEKATPPPKPKSTVDDAQIEAIVGGYHGAPYDVLGLQVATIDGKEGLAVRAFRPLDKKVEVLEIESGKRTPMTQVHPAGFFEATFPRRKERFAYRLAVTGGDDQEYELEDPYRFPMLFPEFDLYLHGEGNFLESYERFGAHMTTVDGVAGVHFAVWAPNAARVSVIGSFNAWDNRVNAMQRRGDAGIWETFIPNLPKGTHYKYSIKSRMLGYEVDKADPYGFFFEVRPTTDARVWFHQLSRSGAPACRVCQRDGLHAHRTAADYRASLRRLVGLSGDGLLCPDQPLRLAR